MIRSILLILLLLMSAPLFAQETTTIDVSTNIQGAITLTPTNLSFGAVQAGDLVSISIGNVMSNASSTATRGSVVVSGTTADVVYTVSGTDLNATNGTTLTIPKTSGSGANVPLEITLAYGVNTTSPTTYTPGTATLGTNDAERSLVVGGSFTSTLAMVGNTYSTSLTILVSYL